MNALQKLRSVVDEIRSSADGLKVVDGWALAERLLTRMPVDQGEASRVVAEKDVAGLDALVASLENPRPQGEDASDSAPKDPGSSYRPETLQAAMKAFKKRLKLGRLADESRLGGRYTSGGRTSNIDAILPPDGFDDGVWKALADAGKLRDHGRGFYGPVE